jgi:aspartate carbamoyltransferase regulatory subunit
MSDQNQPITASSSRIRQVEAIANGTVVDHIPPEMTLKVASLLARPVDQVFVGINLRSARSGRKGVVKVAGREIDPRLLSCLALIAPEATVSIIQDYTVVRKLPIAVPERFDGIARCANPNCITTHERWTTRFTVVGRSPLRVRCTYCERTFDGADLTLL